MRLCFAHIVIGTLAASNVVQSQTPPGTNPATSRNLGVKYGSAEFTSNVLLLEETVSAEPTLYLNQSLQGIHMVMLVDSSIPQSSINSTGPQALGLQYCRGSMPGLNDIAHTSTFYLLPQPDNFTVPSWDAGRGYNPVSVYARMNFSVDAMFVEVGAPVTANYFRAQNPNIIAKGTASNGTCPLYRTSSTNGSPRSSKTVTPYTGTAVPSVDYPLRAAFVAIILIGYTSIA
ncbi:hypothetical protein LTR74_015369 [Friedmanniomyces endolithicus]|nr:hypothetical protein LTR74_015369 [Friedmanniomyces endolithicus]